MTDEDVTIFDMVPNPVPHLGRGCSLLVSKIGPHLNVAAEDDRAARVLFFGNLDKARHLGVVDDNHVGTALVTSREWATKLGPVTLCCFFQDPFVKLGYLFLSQALAVRCYALKNVVIVFGDSENFIPSKRDVPVDLLIWNNCSCN